MTQEVQQREMQHTAPGEQQPYAADPAGAD